MHYVQALRLAEQQPSKLTTNDSQNGTLSPSGLSSRSWEPSQPTSSDRSLGRSPLGRVCHKSRGGSSSKLASSPERQEQAGPQRRPDGRSKVPERHSAYRDGSQKGTQLASPKHRLGRRGRAGSSLRERSVAKRPQHSRSRRQSPSRHSSPGERASSQARLNKTSFKDHAASAQASPSTSTPWPCPVSQHQLNVPFSGQIGCQSCAGKRA